MIPTTFSFIDDIPKNKNGKMDRLKLMHMAELLR
jgi:acyl-coenzyme A synthetase/AMP-(fatty) acid ligase